MSSSSTYLSAPPRAAEVAPAKRVARAPTAEMIRQAARDWMAPRLHVLADIIDGTLLHVTDVRVADLVPHLRCECGTPRPFSVSPGQRPPVRPEYVRVAAMKSPSARDRIAAMDTFGRLGLNPAPFSIVSPEVRARVARTAETIIEFELIPESSRVELIRRLSLIWNTHPEDSPRQDDAPRQEATP